MTRAGTILVVEDEPLLREILAEWLEEEGYTALQANNGIEALRLLETRPVDVIATDIQMPLMDGISLLRRIQSLPGKVPPAILMSGYAPNTLREAYDLGVSEIISKPFTDGQILSALRRIFTPREERWRMREGGSQAQEIRATFAAVNAARDLGALAFGCGGFCVKSQQPFKTGPVRFGLEFTEEAVCIEGEGQVRWVASAESQVGIEIIGLESDCLEQGLRLTVGSGVQCYIPRTAEGVAAPR